jgi:outer membrane protein OmpA-like peptidoglycan-associated protein
MFKKILLGLIFISNFNNAGELVLKNATPNQIVSGFERPEDSLSGSRSRGLNNRNLDPVPNKPPTPVSQNFEILFDFDSANIKSESYTDVQNIAKALNYPKLVNSKFKIEGHTDKVGTYEYNMALSTRRAQSVQSFLIRNGVDARRLSSEGKGYTELNDPSNPTGASNRRVKITRID